MVFKKILLGFSFLLIFSMGFSETEKNLVEKISNNKIVFFQNVDLWNGQNNYCHYRCLIKDFTSETNTELVKIFFYEVNKNGEIKLSNAFEYSDEEFDYSLMIYGKYLIHFLTVWSIGARYVIRTYSLDKDGKIKIILENSSEVPPEVVGGKIILGDCDYLMVSDSGGTRKPQYANVFKWNGTSYALIKHPTWNNRFK